MVENKIPVTVITGFLGSGKTTLLSALLKQKEMAQTAVIINEFGEIGLDHTLIEHSEDNVMELQSGCICCTIKGHLEQTLQDLYNKRRRNEITPFNRVVIETTGLADPAPIINMLMTSQQMVNIYALDGVVTLVDAVNGAQTLEIHPEALKQAAMADRLILSKTDLVEQDVQDALIKCLQVMNPSAPILTKTDGDVAASELFGATTYQLDDKTENVKEWLAMEQYETHHDHDHHHDVNRHSDNIHAFAMTIDEPVDKSAFSFFLDTLRESAGADLLRVKGIVNLGEGEPPVAIHGVQHVFHPPKWLDAWPDEDRRTKLVFITHNISKEQVETYYQSLMQMREGS